MHRTSDGAYSHYDGSRPGDRPAPSFIGFAVVLLRQRFFILRVVILSVLIALITALAERREFTAQSVFMPQGRAAATAMTGLAAQLGLAIPTGDATQNPDFYADLLKSHPVLEAAVMTTYRDSSTPSRTVRLPGVLDVHASSPALAREKTIKKLSRRITPSVDPRTGVVTLSVTAPSGALAQQVNKRLLELLNDFNLRTRQSQAGAERAFIEGRLQDVQAALRAAEDRVATFMRANRSYTSSPDLKFAYDRLVRQVSDQEQLYSMLQQSYERAKMDEVRDTPVITVVQQPEVPISPDSRGWGMKIGFALVIGLMLAIGLAYARAVVWQDGQDGAPESGELSRLLGEIGGEWRRPDRAMRRLIGV